MAIIKIRELIGTSAESFDGALKNLVSHEVAAGKNVTGAKILSESVDIQDGKILEYKVNARVAYKWEK